MQRDDAIRAWSLTVSNSNPTLQGVNSVTGHARSATPSLMNSAGNVKTLSQRRTSKSAKVKPKPKPAPPTGICVRDDGGLSDYDETRGEEREAAINSLPKGKKRVTSEVCKHFYLIQQSNCHNQHLVVLVTSKATETRSKRPRNEEELPEWVDVQWFRHKFVTTYMAFVGQTANPWDVPVKQSVLAMQKIWDATSSYRYKITASTTIYKKVCHQPATCL